MLKKRLVLAMLVAAVVMGSGLAWAADDEKQAKKDETAVKTEAEKQAKPQQNRPQAKRRDPLAARQVFYQQRLKQMQREIDAFKAEHESLVKELEAIKDVAKEEDAEKTVDQVERLIGKLDRQHQAELKVQEERLEQFKKNMEQRMGQQRRPRRDTGENAEEGDRKSPERGQRERGGRQIRARQLPTK